MCDRLGELRGHWHGRLAAKPLKCAVIDQHPFRVVSAHVLSTAFQSCNRTCLSETQMCGGFAAATLHCELFYYAQ